jgi:hypothetical protein
VPTFFLTSTIPEPYRTPLEASIRRALESSGEPWSAELYEPQNQAEWTVVLTGATSKRIYRQSFNGPGEQNPDYIADKIREWLALER